MPRTIKSFRALSGSQVIFFTSDEAEPIGITKKTMLSSFQIESRNSNIKSAIDEWTFNGALGLTGSAAGLTFDLIAGNIIFGPAPGKKQQSLFLDGSTRLEVPLTSALHLSGPITLSVFLFPTGLGTGFSYPVVCAGVGEVSTTNSLYSIQFNSNNSLIPFIEVGNGVDINITPNPELHLNPGTWHHVVYSRDKKDANFIYHNGVLIYSGVEGYPFDGSATQLSIGGWSGGGYFYTGYIYKMKIFERALTPGEIRLESNSVLGDSI